MTADVHTNLYLCVEKMQAKRIAFIIDLTKLYTSCIFWTFLCVLILLPGSSFIGSHVYREWPFKKGSMCVGGVFIRAKRIFFHFSSSFHNNEVKFQSSFLLYIFYQTQLLTFTTADVMGNVYSASPNIDFVTNDVTTISALEGKD